MPEVSRCNSSHDPQKPAHLTTGDRLILDEEHRRHVITYVHLSPVAAGLVGDPFDSPTSGHREVMGLLPPCLCDVDACLRCFDENPSTARAVYQGRLRAVAEARWFRAGVQELPWWKTVDDDEETAPLDGAPGDAREIAGQPLAPEQRRRPPLEEALEAFEREVGVGPGQLAGRRRTRLLSWYRCLFATFAVSWLDHPTKKVAEVLNKGAGSVSRWVAEGLELQLTERTVRSKLDQLARLCGLDRDPPAGCHGNEDVQSTSTS